MKEFSYKICDKTGIHARPAGLLVKKASEFDSEIIIYKDEKTADCKRIFAVLGLSVKCGDTVRVTAKGRDEDAAADSLEDFFKNNL